MTEDKSAIAKALIAAQKEMKHARKDAENTFFKKGDGGTPYATLTSAIDACKDALNKHGIAILQLPVNDSPTMATVETMLLHESGQSISGRLSLPVSKQDAQGHGSAIAYARRYGLLAIVGLASEDDDGNGASEKPHADERHQERPRQTEQRQERPATRQQGKSGGGVMKFGKAKGTPFDAASDRDLQWYRTAVAKGVDDPDKAQYREAGLRTLAEIDQIIAQRENDNAYNEADGRDPERTGAGFGEDDILFAREERG